MKTKNILLIITGLLLTLSGASAEYRIYDNVEDFEAAKGAVCEAATDSCNNFFMIDGKVGGGTRKACGPDFTPEWNCTKFKENTVSTMSITTTAMPVTTDAMPVTTNDNPVACTMEYAPVCGVNGKTYPNKCSAEAAAKVDVDYEGECVAKSKLSANDESFYNVIKKRLDNKYQVAVNNTTVKYIKKLEKYTSIKQERLNKKVISLIDQNISKLLLQYPQDIALPTKVYNVYMTLELFKFELMQLEF